MTQRRPTVKWTEEERKALVTQVSTKRMERPLAPITKVVEEAQETILPRGRRRTIMTMQQVPWLSHDLAMILQNMAWKAKRFEQVSRENEALRVKVKVLEERPTVEQAGIAELLAALGTRFVEIEKQHLEVKELLDTPEEKSVLPSAPKPEASIHVVEAFTKKSEPRRVRFTLVGPEKGTQIRDLSDFARRYPGLKLKIVPKHCLSEDVSGDVIFLWVSQMPHKQRQVIERKHDRSILRWVAGGNTELKAKMREELIRLDIPEKK